MKIKTKTKIIIKGIGSIIISIGLFLVLLYLVFINPDFNKSTKIFHLIIMLIFIYVTIILVLYSVSVEISEVYPQKIGDIRTVIKWGFIPVKQKLENNDNIHGEFETWYDI